VIVVRAADQRVIRDLAGIERRSLSPVLPGVEFELMRMTLAPGVNAGTFPPHRAGSREYLAVETGTPTLVLDGTEYRLKAGDSIQHDGDCEHGYRNDADTPCTYYLAMDVAGGVCRDSREFGQHPRRVDLPSERWEGLKWGMKSPGALL
jgi:quercetin dioxygenase-like cupin family protein